MTSRNGKDWVPHVLDSLDAVKLKKKTIKKGVFCDHNDKSEETIKRRKKVRKLRSIIELEHNLCGEENW